MLVTFDPKKSAWNVTQPGREDLPFEAAERFDMGTALTRRDTRPHPVTGKPYAEPRYQSIGRLDRRTVFLVHTPTENGFRVISLRRADRKERKLWRESQA